MAILTSPQRINLPSQTRVVFLAGSIEMGKAEDWQKRVAEAIEAIDPSIIIANPRRTLWDSSWVQSIDNPVFKEQVDWELDHIERADLVVFYFQGGTQSPITLLELGKHLERGDAPQSTLVCCPEDFWRKGNVDIACQRRGAEKPTTTLDALIDRIETWATR
jgi:hypothetical protein